MRRVKGRGRVMHYICACVCVCETVQLHMYVLSLLQQFAFGLLHISIFIF